MYYIYEGSLYLLEGNPSYGLTLTLAVISRDFMNNHVVNGSRDYSETF